ncbi:MAG: aldo/keto reductase [Treponema sp.]|jgi:diketogulonate reductase-like aldo/keto reductase|nr:aldo/keto reductase [Treponema sp.]
MKRVVSFDVFHFSMAFLLFFSCGTSNNAVVSPAANQGIFDFASRTVMLNNGVKMPILGLGTYRLTPAEAEESVYHALLDGYRLIDTANAYMNERAVGRGIHRSGVPREEIFITTKLWPGDYEDVARAIDDTLARLNVEYIDLLLLHQPYGNVAEGYRGMEAALKQGKVRSIGISNFYEKKVGEIMSIATIPPAVLQVESNPYYHQVVMREYVNPYGTVLMAWYPLGGRVDEHNTQTLLFNEETIVEIAAAHNKTPAQVILRWHLQTGNIAIPGSRNPDHIQENISIFDFELTDEEMRRLSALDTGSGAFDFSNVDEEMDFGSFGTRDFNDQE